MLFFFLFVILLISTRMLFFFTLSQILSAKPTSFRCSLTLASHYSLAMLLTTHACCILVQQVLEKMLSSVALIKNVHSYNTQSTKNDSPIAE